MILLSVEREEHRGKCSEKEANERARKKLRWRGPWMGITITANFLLMERPKEYFKMLGFNLKLFPL